MEVINLTFTNSKEFEQMLEGKKVPEKMQKSKQAFIQVFFGIPEKEKIVEFLDYLKGLFPGVPILGTTTAGEIRSMKVYSESIVVSISFFEKTEVRTYVFPYREDISESELGKLIARECVSRNTKGLLMFADALHANLQYILKGIESIHPELPVFGGAAGDNLRLQKTYVFTEEGIVSKGTVVASFNSKELKIHQGFKLNWVPIGKTMTVTKAQGTILQEIDGISAVEIYRRYLGETEGYVAAITPAFPLLVKRGEELWVARAASGETEEGGLILVGNIEEGEKVRLSYGYLPEVIDETRGTFYEILKYPVEALFVYSCAARSLFLQHMVAMETSPLRKIAPLAGFFTYGEFFHINGKNELLNDTMTFVAMSENTVKKDLTYKETPLTREDKYIKLLKAITLLGNTVTSELEDVISLLHDQQQELQQLNEELRQAHEETMAINEELKHKNATLKELNKELREQKQRNEKILKELEESHQEIQDSIQYARRIQQALLPNIQFVANTFPDYGYFFIPRDEVGGDFYWFRETEESFYFLLGDCTGHGVPGAMMTMLGISSLNSIFPMKAQKEFSPAELLNELTNRIYENLQANVGENAQAIKDGMEVILVKVRKKNKNLILAGAKRPLWYAQGEEIKEIHTDKFTIVDAPFFPFTEKTLSPDEYSQLYLFTDGIVDQFGGKRDRKISKKRFKSWLTFLRNMPAQAQAASLLQKVRDWQKTTYKQKQTDDMTFFTFKKSS